MLSKQRKFAGPLAQNVLDQLHLLCFLPSSFSHAPSPIVDVFLSLLLDVPGATPNAYLLHRTFLGPPCTLLAPSLHPPCALLAPSSHRLGLASWSPDPSFEFCPFSSSELPQEATLSNQVTLLYFFFTTLVPKMRHKPPS